MSLKIAPPFYCWGGDSYPGMSLHLTDESVSREAQFGDPCVPDVFNQRADFISFGDIVRRTAEAHEPPCKTTKKHHFFFVSKVGLTG